MGRKLAGCMVLAIVFGLGACLAFWLLQRGGGFIATHRLTANTSVPIKLDTTVISDPGAIARAAAKVEPSVVTIDTVYRPVATYGSGGPFDIGPEQEVIPRGAGSGVIISPDGIIVTNNHVVQDATTIHVTLHDGQQMDGRVLGADAPSDLAVVKVDRSDLPAITLTDSDKVQIGQWVIAVGNPLGLGITLTAGIVSAIRKGPELEGTELNNAIQTDAPINPGNSGGALADLEGRLVGINSVIASPTGSNVGIGFAIPVNTVRQVVGQLIRNGHIPHPWLGIKFGPLTDQARAELNIPAEINGVIVGVVYPGSPADGAGRQVGDVIQKANGTDLTGAADLQTIIRRLKIGDTLQMDVWRAGQALHLNATLQESPASTGGQAGP